MRKHISNIFRFFIVLFIAVIFASCSFLNDSTKEKDSSQLITEDLTDSKTTFTFTGTISISEGAFPSSLVNKSKASNTTRAAWPEIPTNLTYSITASDGTDTVEGTQTDNTSFQFVLQSGKEWTVTAVLNDASGNPLLRDSWIIPASNKETNLFHRFWVKPVITSGGTGTLALTILLNNDLDGVVSKVTADCKSSTSNTENWEVSVLPTEENMTFEENSPLQVSVSQTSIASGQYEVSFNFYDASNVLVYNTVQTINIFDNLTTNTWVSGGGSGPIKSDGTFELTKDLIDGYSRTHLYVGATAFCTSPSNDNATGTAAKPFASVTGAIDYLKMAGSAEQDYTIYLVGSIDGGQIIEDSSDTIPTKSITLIGFNGLDSSTNQPKDSIEASDTEAALTISTEIPVTVKDLKISKGTGHGVFVSSDSKVYLAGTPIIDDLYLESNAYDGTIFLAEELSSGASITITPTSYENPHRADDEDRPVVKEHYVFVEEGSGIDISDNSEYFHITPEVDGEGNTTATEWFIDEEGCLNRYCTLSFSGEGTNSMSATKIPCKYFTSASELPSPEREGYLFNGWYYNQKVEHYNPATYSFTYTYKMSPIDFKDEAYYDEDDILIEDYDYTFITSDITLYATWISNSDTIYINAGDSGVDYAYIDEESGAENTIKLGDGSATAPLKSISSALNSIKILNDATKDYTFLVTGLTEDIDITIDENVPAKSITLQGAVETNEGEEPSCGIKRTVYYNEITTTLSVSGNVPVRISNFIFDVPIQGNEGDGAIINIGEDGQVTLDNGTLFKGHGSTYGGAIPSNGVIAVENNGTLVMKTGAVIDNYYIVNGTVYVKEGGLFTMEGGTISNTDSSGNGGAVCINGGTFTMESGLITSNTSSDLKGTYGAGVCVKSGSFIMNGGEIKNNISYIHATQAGLKTAGGGVFVYAEGSFEMTGGEISGNKALNAHGADGTPDSSMLAYGGGVCLQASGNKIASFTMTGGTISGNTAGTSGNGIGFLGTPSEGTTGIITIGGTAVINSDNDIYLPDFVTIAVESELTNITAENKIVITPKTYSPSVQALVVAENADKALMSEFSKFTVTPDGSQEWSLSEQGKLQTFVDVSSICNQITSMTSSGTVTLVGEMTVDDVPQITAALKTLYENNPSVNVTLDMSDVYGFTEFPDKAFYDSTSYSGPDNFVGISLPKSLTAIGVRAFWSCTHLSSVIIPEGVITISQQAFESCEGLESITIPETVTYLDTQAFASSGLKSINLPKNLERIGELTFGSAPLSTITVAEDNSYFSAEDGVLYNADKTQLVLYPIGKEDKSFSIPSSVTSIARAAFLGSQLETISIPDTVSAIGNQAFQSCSKLKSLTLPSALTIINPQILDRCSLTSLVIPDNVTKIMGSAFRDSTSLKSITLPASLISIANGAFDSCTALEKVFYKGTESQKDSIDIQDYKIKSSDVTWVYNFGNIGSKSAPSAVGDIVFYDGTAIAYSDTLTLTNEQKAAAIAVIVYKGTECSNNGTSRMLGVGLVQERGATLTWCTSDANAADTEINSIECSASGDGPDAVYSGDLNGSDNFTQIADILENNNDTDNETKYPVFYWAKNYATYATNLSGTAFEDGWYIPSIAELLQVRNSCVDTEETVAPGNGNELYNALELCGGHTIQKTRAADLPNGDVAGGNYYFSSSQHINSNSAFIMDFYDASWNSQEKTVNGMGADDETNVFTLVIREF